MKYLLPACLGVACLALAVALIMSNQKSNAQHEEDANAITSCSNELSSAQTQIASCKGTISTFSNQLVTCQSGSLTFSNQLVETRTDLAATTGRLNLQITNLNLQITQSESERQALNQRNVDLANQVIGLTNQIAWQHTNLDQAHKDYALLENRFRRDVAERVLVERKFNNLSELKAQIEELKFNPAREISADRIREGLNVVVKSNMCYVIAPE